MKKKLFGLFLLTSMSSVALSGCFLFKTKYYDVNFYASVDNSLIHHDSVKKGDKFSYPEAPTFKGYTFVSWSEEIKKVTSNLDIYANYRANIYNITLDYNQPGVSNGTLQVTYDQNYTLDSPSYGGHTFKGWFDENGTKYSGGVYKIDSNITLKALWDLVNYTVTYNLDGGTNDSSNPTSINYDDKVVLKDASKEGFDFKGWYSDSNFEKQVTELSETIANVNLFAKFEIKKYDVKFYVGEQAVYSTIVEYGKTAKFDSSYNYNPNGTFVGWYINGAKTDLDKYAIYENTYIYAKYDENCLYLKKDSSNGRFIIGNNACSIIGFELTLKFKANMIATVKDAIASSIYNIEAGYLYMNVMFDENDSSSKVYLSMEINTNLSVDNIVDSYQFVIYERVDGQIKIVGKDFLIF